MTTREWSTAQPPHPPESKAQKRERFFKHMPTEMRDFLKEGGWLSPEDADFLRGLVMEHARATEHGLIARVQQLEAELAAMKGAGHG